MSLPSSLARPAWPDFGAQGLDHAWLRRHVDYCHSRFDLADHRLLLILRTLFSSAETMDADAREMAAEAVAGFRYSITEPGRDSMCTWSESHRVVFATCEYLGGQLLPDRTFTNDGRKGVRHQRSAHRKLQTWLSDRFRFGFSEWLSGIYYTFTAAALTMLIDHAEDADLARQAEMVLDLLALDLALHRFEGRFVASSGRSDAVPKMDPGSGEIQVVVDALFGVASGALDLDRLGSIVVTGQRYQVPALIREIADDVGVSRVRSSQGLNLDEVVGELAAHPDCPRSGGLDLLRFQWAMGALTTPESIRATLDVWQRYELQHNRLLAPLEGFAKIPKALRTTAVRTLDPITAGGTLQRANVQTFRTPSYLLSSAQHYQPGGWGDQQSIWQAALPGGISVFGTHPGSTVLSGKNRAPTPNHWVGNGINPDVAQHDNVLLALVDLRKRRGYLEGLRQHLVHFYVPSVQLDETRLGPTWFAGRKAHSYIGIVATSPLELVSESELVQRGDWMGYAVVLSDDEEFISMADFIRQLKQLTIRLRGKTLTFVNPYGRYELTWGGGLRISGRLMDTRYPRYDTQWGTVPRNPRTLTLSSESHRLHLDFPSRTREDG